MTAAPAAPEVALPSGDLLIDGAWVADGGDGRRQHVNPATGAVLTDFAMAGVDDVDRAVRSSAAAFPAWRAWPPNERREVLLRIAALLERDDMDLAVLRSLEIGAVLKRKRGLSMAAEYWRYYAGWCDKIEGATIPTYPGKALDYTRPEPYGVVAVIIPWNGAVVSAGMKVAPALAAGNCVVLKPSELAPLAALRFGELCLEAGLPPGVLNIVPGGPEAGNALVSHPGIAKISFTGGGPTARRVMAAAAQQLTPVMLELGGKSASIVFEDADLDLAAMMSVQTSVVSLSGQGCVLPTRLLVHDAVYDQVEAKVAAHVDALRMGDPFDETVQIGPVIDEVACERILGVIDRAKASGSGRLLAGGGRAGGELARGFYVEPTVFTDVDRDSEVAQDEIFGPVLSMVRFTDDDDAVSIANGTPFGLGAFVYTNDLRRSHRMADALDAGTIGINGFPPMPANAPFGGVKQSGFGREGGRVGLDEYLRVKNVYVAL